MLGAPGFPPAAVELAKQAQEDDAYAAALDELILQLTASLGLTVIMISHDLDSLWRVTDRVAFLGEKHILALDSMDALSRARHPEIREYFSGPRGRASKEHNA